jgi:hypothetical protein
LIEKHDGTAMEQLKLLNVIADELKKKNGKN